MSDRHQLQGDQRASLPCHLRPGSHHCELATRMSICSTTGRHRYSLRSSNRAREPVWTTLRVIVWRRRQEEGAKAAVCQCLPGWPSVS